jgi:hypothetical protein
MEVVMNESDQVQNLQDRLPVGGAPDPNAPRIPFATNYVLTRAQEDALVEFALKRVDQLEGQLGRNDARALIESGKNASGRTAIGKQTSFMGKRARYRHQFYGDMEWRKEPDTVYQHSNYTASLAQRIAMQMIARAIKFFLGQPDDTDWFSSEAVGVEDEAVSDKIKKHSRWKVDQCGVKQRFMEAIEFAFVTNESIVKVTHQQRGQIYKRKATVLMGKDGNPDEPILDANGDYIVFGDKFVHEMAVPEPGVISRVVDAVKNFFVPGVGSAAEAAAQGEQPEQQPPGGEVQPAQGMERPPAVVPPEQQMQPTGAMVLKRDGVTQEPPVPIWKEQVITRRLITFEGPDAAVVYFADFLCPESAGDIQTADLVAHLYDMNVMKVAEMFQGQMGEGDAKIANIAAAVERLRDLTNAGNTPKSAAGQPRSESKETDTSAAPTAALCEIAECYLTYDADNDGIEEEIMLILDRANKAPIYYEYLANVTVRGLRPFRVVRPMPVDQRWYGLGSMELFDPEQSFIDLQLNRHNFNTSAAGRVTFWNPFATVEGDRDPNLKLNHGKTYTLKDGKKAEDALSYVELTSDSERLEKLLDLFMQFMQLKSGVLTGADRASASLPSSNTLGEEKLITDSGDELFDRVLAHLFPGIKGALSDVIDVIYANMNTTEVFSFFNGDANEIVTLTPDEVRDLALNVTLVLSRSQQRKALETGAQADDTIDRFYGRPPILQERTAQFTRGKLKALGVSQADKVIEPLDPALMAPAQGPDVAGQPSQVSQPQPAQPVV